MPSMRLGELPILRTDSKLLDRYRGQGLFREDLLRKCNTFHLPIGRGIGSGWVLMSRRDWERYLEEAGERPEGTPHLDLVLHNDPPFAEREEAEEPEEGEEPGDPDEPDPPFVTIPNVTPRRAVSLMARAGREDEDAIMAVQLVDVRYIFHMCDVGNKAWNIRRTDGVDGDGDGDYWNSTDGSTSWDDVLSGLWTLLPPTLRGPIPTLNDPPDSIPENLNFAGKTVWGAICELADFLHQVPYFDSAEGDNGEWKFATYQAEVSSPNDRTPELMDERYLQYESQEEDNPWLVSPATLRVYTTPHHNGWHVWPGRYYEFEVGTGEVSTTYIDGTSQRCDYPLANYEDPHLYDTALTPQDDADLRSIARDFGSRQTDAAEASMEKLYGRFAEFFLDGGVTDVFYRWDGLGTTKIISRYQPPYAVARPCWAVGMIEATLEEDMEQGETVEAAIEGGSKIVDVQDANDKIPDGVTIAEGTAITIYAYVRDSGAPVWVLENYACDGGS